MKRNISKRVAVTGLGIITSIGQSVDAFWERLILGACGIGQISVLDVTNFPCQAAAQIRGLPLDDLRLQFGIKRASRCDILGLIAAHEAVQDSELNLDRCDRDKIGVILGGGAGGMLSWEQYRRKVWLKGFSKKPSTLFNTPPSTLTDLIAYSYGLTGIRTTITTACSSSATAIGYSYDLVKSGALDVAISGGSESLSELTFAGFNALRVMDPVYCRPFDRNRQGLSLGEGAAILVLEDYHQAEERGANIYAEVLGYAINSDAFHMTSSDPEGKGMSQVMMMGLRNSGTSAYQIDYINAHGTGTILNDRVETKAIKKVFGKSAAQLSISSTKSSVGHCLGAAGGIEAVTTILTVHEGIIPPTIHLESRDPDCDLDFVPNQSRIRNVQFAMSNSFAFGGNNTSIIFAKITE
jgi:3-oxoacyl-[acyl-carrier-protein] synthase II